MCVDQFFGDGKSLWFLKVAVPGCRAKGKFRALATVYLLHQPGIPAMRFCWSIIIKIILIYLNISELYCFLDMIGSHCSNQGIQGLISPFFCQHSTDRLFSFSMILLITSMAFSKFRPRRLQDRSWKRRSNGGNFHFGSKMCG